MTQNKKLGNDFELDFCEILFKEGFWVHNLAQNASGQPADVIAVRDGKAYLIDCKVCSPRGLDFSRIEENQDLSMELWKECGNGAGWFAVLIDAQIMMIPHPIINYLRKWKSRMSMLNIKEHGILLEEWLTFG